MPDSPDLPPPQKADSPVELHYLSPSVYRDRGPVELNRAIAGAAITTLAVCGLGFVWLTNSSKVRPFIAICLVFASIGGIVIVQYTRHQSTAFAKGIVIGLVIAALIAALFFMANAH